MTSSPTRTCRLCQIPEGEGSIFNADPEFKGNILLSPCACKGHSKYIHAVCLEAWAFADPGQPKKECEVCRTPYALAKNNISWKHRWNWLRFWSFSITWRIPMVLFRIFVFHDYAYAKFSSALIALFIFQSFASTPFHLHTFTMMLLSVQTAFAGMLLLESIAETLFVPFFQFTREGPPSPNTGNCLAFEPGSVEFFKAIEADLSHSKSLQMQIWSPHLAWMPNLVTSRVSMSSLLAMAGSQMPGRRVVTGHRAIQQAFEAVLLTPTPVRHMFKIIKLVFIAIFKNFMSPLEDPLKALSNHMAVLFMHAETLLHPPVPRGHFKNVFANLKIRR